jgi:hypothetical protein
MFCPQCGASNADNAAVCVQCGRNLQAAVPATPIQTPGVVLPPGATIQNYLVFGILSTVLCCPATGIPAIIYAAQVNGKLQAGDLAGAKTASNNAKMWCWISFGIGLAGTVLWLLLMMLGILSRLHQS